MGFLGYILIFLLVLSIIVLIHEFGHFLFARRAGILCHEFSIGMGPAIYKIKRGETTYAIRAIPLGGYVAMAGEDPETEKVKKGQIVYLQTKGNEVQNIFLFKPEDQKVQYAKVIDFDLYGRDGGNLYFHYEDENGQTYFVTVARDAFYQFPRGQEIQIAPYDRCFESKTWLQRFLTVVAGASFNFILAIIIFIIINLATGVPVSQPIISEFNSEDSNGNKIVLPAEAAGLEAGDEIIKMAVGNEEPTNIKSWSDISDFMDQYETGVIKITVKRDGNIIATPYEVEPEIFIATMGVYSTNDLNDTIIGRISPNSTADKAELKEGDQIIKITGTLNDDKNTPEKENDTLTFDNLTTWQEITAAMENFYLAEEVNITVIRNGNTLNPITVQTIKALDSEIVSQAKVGISQKTEFNFFKSLGYGVTDTVGVIGSIFETLDLLFTDKNVSVRDLSGPVGIYDMTKTFAMSGFLSLLGWMAFISANIGFVNLLPLPALDGGRLIFLLIEGVVRKPVNRKVEGYIHTVGFILFMMLFIFITFNDILRLRG